MQLFSIVGFTLLSLFLLSIIGSARTITVDDDGGADHTKIQDAIDNATKGDVILVFAGNYIENIIIDKQIALIGNGSSECFINGDGVENVIEITSDGVNISGFYCSNGDIGIHIRSENVSIINISCSNTDDYGIYLNGSRNTVLSSNIISGTNTGIFIQSSTNIIVKNNICKGNWYGIRIVSSNNNSITSNTCEENIKEGIYLRSESNNNKITDNRIQANEDGIRLLMSNNNSIENNSIINNEDGIYINKCARISIEGNHIDGSSRIGMNLGFSNNISVENNVIQHSIKHGVKIDNVSHLIMTNCSIIDNAIGIYVRRSSQNITVVNCNIMGNSEWGINASSNDGMNIIATNNWWGTPSGPFHNETNSEGKGDNVTDYIAFDPWLEQPLDYFPPSAVIESSYPGFVMKYKSITFEASVVVYGLVDNYIWASDIDGEFYNGTKESFTYSMLSNGTHSISLMIVDNFGVQSEMVETTVTVNGKPISHLDFIIPNPVTVSHSIFFSGHGTDDGTIQRYVWKTNDTELHNGTTSDFSTSELERGTHWIYFSVLDNLGIWSDEVVQTVIVHERPTGEITQITPNPALVTDMVSFDGIGTDDGSIQRYVWYIDTLEIHNDTYPAFIYSTLSVDSYTVSFRVQDNFGVWSREVMDTLIIHELPVASIVSITQNPGIVGESFIFAGVGIDDGTIERYVWRTNETELYNGTNSEFSISILPVSTPTIYFRVQDYYGVWSDEVSAILIIHERPIATIESISPNPVMVTAMVTFTANGTDDGEIERYVWWEGKNELYNGTEAEFSTSDLSSGEYTINLMVQDNYGVWSEAVSQELEILADSDRDGIANKDDAFIEDPAASKDTDGDGYPDEWNEGKTGIDSTTGLKLDDYPDDSKKWKREENEPYSTNTIIASIIVIFAVVGMILIKKKRKSEIF